MTSTGAPAPTLSKQVVRTAVFVHRDHVADRVVKFLVDTNLLLVQLRPLRGCLNQLIRPRTQRPPPKDPVRDRQRTHHPCEARHGEDYQGRTNGDPVGNGNRLCLYIHVYICTYLYIYIYMSKASGVHLGRLTPPHGEPEAYLDRLASTKHVSDVKNLI